MDTTVLEYELLRLERKRKMTKELIVSAIELMPHAIDAITLELIPVLLDHKLCTSRQRESLRNILLVLSTISTGQDKLTHELYDILLMWLRSCENGSSWVNCAIIKIRMIFEAHNELNYYYRTRAHYDLKNLS